LSSLRWCQCVERGHDTINNAKIYRSLALQLNMEKSKEDRNEEFFLEWGPWQMKAVPFLGQSGNNDPATLSHTWSLNKTAVHTSCVLTMRWALMVFLRALMVDGIRIFKEAPAAFKITFCHCAIVHSWPLTISRQNSVCSMGQYPHHSAVYKDVPFVTHNL